VFAGYSFYPTKPLGSYGDAGLITSFHTPAGGV
jgi:hypothetical protein